MQNNSEKGEQLSVSHARDEVIYIPIYLKNVEVESFIQFTLVFFQFIFKTDFFKSIIEFKCDFL